MSNGLSAIAIAAVKDVSVLFLPVLPFALLFGVMVVESGVPQILGWSSSVIMFGGAAQMTLITLIGEGAAISAAVTTTLIVTARHILYSVSLAPRFQGQPGWFRWVGPYILIDQVLQGFYDDVVEELRAWQPKAPRIRRSQKSDNDEVSSQKNVGSNVEPDTATNISGLTFIKALKR
ncbi:AzlC family ABC transporter permease [bacterium]|nr:AzlC family ABC transporter permease [bacterium]